MTAVMVEPEPAVSAGWTRLPAPLIERVRPSIVRVGGRGRSGASGIVWPPGAVLTNHHVVAGAATEVPVTLADGRVLAARVVRASRRLDLALLALEADALAPAPIGDSTRLRVGELVFAVGHPWGINRAATSGIVIGLGGDLPEAERDPNRREWLMVSLVLRPGNSGGPLVDVSGRLVGVNTIMTGPSVGGAVPVHVVRQFLREATLN